jgi:transcriptional regulator with XRE-family HTH domain
MHIGAVSTIIVDFMTPAQSRAARALLELNQCDLAQNAGVGLSTIVDFEKGRRQVSQATIIAIEAAFERAGVQFIEENGGGEGVRLRKPRRSTRK